uniref:Glyceraldehyde-3-phosphate dehydrogenase n=1 Tax=Mustela putorius furo TaxID=9669 RepID=M3YJH6_MUSPF
FGHIGCLVTRAAFNSGKMDTVIIDDPFIYLNYMVYMFLYDSTPGKFNSIVKTENRKLASMESPSPSSRSDPANIKWGDAGAKYVVESKEVFTTMDKSAHLEVWAKRIIIPPPSANVPMFVIGKNQKYDNSLKTDSNAFCTTNSLAPLAKIIHHNFGIMERLMTHAITATQKILDSPFGKLWHDSQRAAQNILGTATAVGKIIPGLIKQLTNMTFQVPTSNMSVMDVTCHLKKAVKYNDIKKLLKGPLKSILGDLNSDTHSSTFNAGTDIALKDHFFKNEFGYNNQVMDFMGHTASK